MIEPPQHHKDTLRYSQPYYPHVDWCIHAHTDNSPAQRWAAGAAARTHPQARRCALLLPAVLLPALLTQPQAAACSTQRSRQYTESAHSKTGDQQPAAHSDTGNDTH
jgi:hypothetical protein